MREFVFDIHYEEEPVPIRTLVDDQAELSSVGVGGCIGSEEFWRIEQFSGSPDALSELCESRLQRVLDTESITEEECDGTVHVEILERTEQRCEVYYHMKGVTDCDSVATLAVEYLSTDVLFELKRDHERDRWAVMTETDDGVGLLYDALQISLRPTLRFEFGHLGQASDRRIDLFAKKNLPPEQRDALVAAVSSGYYETPRQTTLEELSAKLECPRSTLSYRLRRAESQLAKAFAMNAGSELTGLPRTEETKE